MKKKNRRKLLQALALGYRKIPWLIGDLLNRVEDTSHSNISDGTGFSDPQLYDFARVAKIFKKEDRLDYVLPWTYFRDAGSDRKYAIPALQAAVRNGWSREQLRQAVRALKGTK